MQVPEIRFLRVSSVIETGSLLEDDQARYLNAVAEIETELDAQGLLKTLGEIDRVWLYTAFGYPHTSCGCFEGLAFYIPENPDILSNKLTSSAVTVFSYSPVSKCFIFIRTNI